MVAPWIKKKRARQDAEEEVVEVAAPAAPEPAPVAAEPVVEKAAPAAAAPKPKKARATRTKKATAAPSEE